MIKRSLFAAAAAMAVSANGFRFAPVRAIRRGGGDTGEPERVSVKSTGIGGAGSPYRGFNRPSQAKRRLLARRVG